MGRHPFRGRPTSAAAKPRNRISSPHRNRSPRRPHAATAEVFMKAGRLAAEYLVSIGQLPPSSLPAASPRSRESSPPPDRRPPPRKMRDAPALRRSATFHERTRERQGRQEQHFGGRRGGDWADRRDNRSPPRRGRFDNADSEDEDFRRRRVRGRFRGGGYEMRSRSDVGRRRRHGSDDDRSWDSGSERENEFTDRRMQHDRRLRPRYQSPGRHGRMEGDRRIARDTYLRNTHGKRAFASRHERMDIMNVDDVSSRSSRDWKGDVVMEDEREEVNSGDSGNREGSERERAYAESSRSSSGRKTTAVVETLREEASALRGEQELCSVEPLDKAMKPPDEASRTTWMEAVREEETSANSGSREDVVRERASARGRKLGSKEPVDKFMNMEDESSLNSRRRKATAVMEAVREEETSENSSGGEEILIERANASGHEFGITESMDKSIKLAEGSSKALSGLKESVGTEAAREEDFSERSGSREESVRERASARGQKLDTTEPMDEMINTHDQPSRTSCRLKATVVVEAARVEENSSNSGSMEHVIRERASTSGKELDTKESVHKSTNSLDESSTISWGSKAAVVMQSVREDDTSSKSGSNREESKRESPSAKGVMLNLQDGASRISWNFKAVREENIFSNSLSTDISGSIPAKGKELGIREPSDTSINTQDELYRTSSAPKATVMIESVKEEDISENSGSREELLRERVLTSPKALLENGYSPLNNLVELHSDDDENAVKIREEKHPEPATYKTCDLNLMESPDITEIPEIPGDPCLNHPVGFDLWVGSNIGNGDDINRVSGAGKLVQLIDLENDCETEDYVYGSSKLKSEDLYSSLKSHMLSRDGATGARDSYNLEIPELFGGH